MVIDPNVLAAPTVIDCKHCNGVGWFPAGPEDIEDCTYCDGYGQIVVGADD